MHAPPAGRYAGWPAIGVLVALLGVAPVGPSAAVTRDAASPVERLAAHLAAQPEPVRADFAGVALGEMLVAYELEFDRLSPPGRVSRGELAKQLRWAGALRAFLDGLYAARDELDAGAPVEILVAPPSPVQLLVGDRLVPLSAPRIENPESLGSGIVTVYCETFGCDDEVLAHAAEAAPRAEPRGGWSFRDGWGSTYETASGLGFMFPDVRRRSAKERACLQVEKELRRLVAWLSAAPRPGIEYGQLSVESASDGGARLVISARGDSVRLPLPALARAPGVVEVAREWIRARVEGRPYHQLFPRADLLLSALMEARSPPPR